MKKLLLIFLLLPVLLIAQTRPNPPVLTYRQGNANQLDIQLSRSGIVLTPSASMTISTEVRASEDSRVLLKLLFTRPDTSTRLRAFFPTGLGDGSYVLGLLIQQTGLPDYRTGLAKLVILPGGSLQLISSVSNLTVNILPQTTQPINITAELNASLVAYYNQQAQAIKNHVDSVYVQVVSGNGLALSSLNSFAQSQAQRDTGQDQAISGKANQSTTYTKIESNNLIANKPDDTPVSTFAAAKLLVTPGVKRAFTITNNELFGASTHSKYDGANWSHAPALFQNN